MSADAPGLDAPAILAIFDSHQVEYVVVGGYAANLHGSTRVTIDIDVTPNRTLRNLARLAAALRDLGGGIRVDDLDHGLAFDASPESLADRMGHAQITTPRNTSTPSRTPTPRTSPRSTGSAAPSPHRSPPRWRSRPTERTDRWAKGRGPPLPPSTAEAAAKGHRRRHIVSQPALFGVPVSAWFSTRLADLVATLTSPARRTVDLFSHVGGSGNNVWHPLFSEWRIDRAASTTVRNGVSTRPETRCTPRAMTRPWARSERSGLKRGWLSDEHLTPAEGDPTWGVRFELPEGYPASCAALVR